MNLAVLKISRKVPKAGDVFVLQPLGRDFYFGCVIRTDATIGGFKNVILLYIYDITSPTKNPVPQLSPLRLLIPPKGTNRRPWTMGYFETIAHKVLLPQDVLSQHCFYDPLRKGYVDADGRERTTRFEPCGFDALDSFRTIDDAISRALGIPLAPDPPGSFDRPQDPGNSKKKRKRRDVEHSVTLYLADAGGGPLDNADLEDRLGLAAAEAGAGEWTGNEYSLQVNHAYIHFTGKDADALAEALLPVLRATDLPKGSYLLKLYGEPGDAEERIDL